MNFILKLLMVLVLQDALHTESLRALDQKMVGKILDENQIARLRELVQWHLVGEKSARGIVETLGSAPLKNFQQTELNFLIPQKEASRSDQAPVDRMQESVQ